MDLQNLMIMKTLKDLKAFKSAATTARIQMKISVFISFSFLKASFLIVEKASL